MATSNFTQSTASTSNSTQSTASTGNSTQSTASTNNSTQMANIREDPSLIFTEMHRLLENNNLIPIEYCFSVIYLVSKDILSECWITLYSAKEIIFMILEQQ